MQRSSVKWSALALLLIAAKPAAAHFVWIDSKKEGEKLQVVAGFGEPGDWDAALVGRIKDTKYWSEGSDGAAKPIEAKFDEVARIYRIYVGDLHATAVLASCDFGVVTIGKGKPAHLRYTAKHLLGAPAGWSREAPSTKLRIQTLASFRGDAVALSVFFDGKPLADAAVKTTDPAGAKAVLKTDSQGIAEWKVSGPGKYLLYVGNTVANNGIAAGKPYESEKDYNTLTFSLSPDDIAGSKNVVQKSLPPLPEAVTSFGAAVADGWLYVYSGHTGGTHEHSRDNLSKHFRRLNLNAPTKWQELSAGPPLQGLPLVAYRSGVVRVGGVAAWNAPNEEEDMRSIAEVARFDVDRQVWSNLPSLPQPRSSHDAAVIGDHLYVVGGWNLQGKKGAWEKTALRLNLADRNAKWEQIATPPFERRALAAAACGGKLYVIGGLTKSRDLSSDVTVYNPANGSWSKAASLPAGQMLAFGPSAVAYEDHLFLSGMAADLYRLDGDKWTAVAKLASPRFMHRLLVGPRGDLMAVAGSSRSSHLADVETFTPR